MAQEEKEEYALSCPTCGDLFFTTNSRKKFCNNLCSYKYFNKLYSKKKKKYSTFSREKKDRINKRIALKKLKEKMDLYEVMGNKCYKCGFDDIRALQIDHVNGGGCKELKKTSHSRLCYYKKVEESFKKGEGRYQLLCANCNWIKRHEKNENVHKKK